MIGATLAALLAAADGGSPSGSSTTCRVGRVEVRIELREVHRPLGGEAFQAVHLVRPGKPDLRVPFTDDNARAWLAPRRGLANPCDKTLAMVKGDMLLVLLAEEGRPNADFAISFLYSASKHAIVWQRHDDEEDRVGGGTDDAELDPKLGLCISTAWIGEAANPVCLPCEKTWRGVKIDSIWTGDAFTQVRCFQVDGERVTATLDPERTWARAGPQLKNAFESRQAFERGFWLQAGNTRYGKSHAQSVRLADGRVCAVPVSDDSVREHREFDRDIVCPALLPDGGTPTSARDAGR